MCVLAFAFALFTFILHVLIFTLAAFETLIYSMENTRDIFQEKRNFYDSFSVSMCHFDILVPVLHILFLLVLCKNCTSECFDHFYKIKIRESVKNHSRNLKKTKIAIYRFQKYAQKNLFSSFSTMLKPGFDYVLSTPLNHGFI